MTSEQNPPSGADARRDSPPPQPPPYSDGVPELPGDAPESSTQQSRVRRSEDELEQPRMKPEGSAYPSAYRPGEEAHIHNTPLAASSSHEQFDFDPAAIHDAEPAPDHPPPAYTEHPGILHDEGGQLGTNAVVSDDGRVNIRIDQKNRSLSQLIVPQLQRQLTRTLEEPAPPPPYIPESLGGAPGQQPPPALNVVIQVVGSRGDVQPFVALGKVLKETYGHRVRLATHATFKDFVKENGLEFFSIGGDPAELMAFMVRNPGLMPGFDTLRSGEVGKRRKGIAEILRGTWRSCIETGDGLSVDPLKQTVEEWMGIEDQLPEELKKPFVADVIIANPPSFGHIHCAEKLGIPLHMMFTMPWSPTQQFPHPLANVQSSNADPTITNFMSYILVDMLTWQGLGDVTNKFRKDALGLDPISIISSPAILERLKIPTTYCWSPALIPKPKDWGHHISISGFFFLSLAQNYTPAPDLAQFLSAGEPPVYIGFGSIVVDDPNAMTKMIFDAVKLTGRRALVSKGWGGLGGDDLGVPDGVFMLGNCPHDWLFQHVAAVVHHGGAGTTAAGIAAGRPTVIVPFFGDQPFWGSMVAKAGAGPNPIPYKELTAEKLAGAIKEALKPESLDRAKELSNKISKEKGTHNAAQSFHQLLKYDDLRCAVAQQHPAVWRVKRTQVRLSAQAATVLAQDGQISFSDLKLFRPREYITDEGPWDPFTGAASALIGTAGQMMMGVADFPIETLKLLNIHPDASRKGKGKAKQTSSGTPSETTRSATMPAAERATNTRVSAGSSSSTLPDTQVSVSELNGTSAEDSQAVTQRCGFMARAMSQASEVSHSRSRSRDRLHPGSPMGCSCGRPRCGHSRSSSISAAELRSNSNTVFPERSFSDKLHDMHGDSIIGTGKGVGRIVGAGFKSPLDFSMNVAQGFHNVPKLYGGEVRQVDKVTDFQSGLKTAAKQFGFGLYDGIAGLVTDPYKGAKKEGGVGFVKGVGRGIFSVPFRVMGGAWSVPAYAMKGLYQEMLKNKGSTVQNYIIAARISQGYDEASTLSPEQRADIVARWKQITLTVKKKKNPGEEQLEALHTLMSEKRKKKLAKMNARSGKRTDGANNRDGTDLPEVVAHSPTPTSSSQTTYPLHHAHTYPSPEPPPHYANSAERAASFVAQDEAERIELEAAIKASVSETSRGDPAEDELIARAIRASMVELQREPAPQESEEEALHRAMQASLEEAQRSGVSEEEQKVLEETLRRSLVDAGEQRGRKGKKEHGSDSEWDSDSEDEEDEEELFQRVAAESKELQRLHLEGSADEYLSTVAGAQTDSLVKGGSGEEDEEELKRVLEESERAERERRVAEEKLKSEEEVVMEYVKKQSLREEELRRRRMEGRDVVGESSGAGS